MNGEEKLLEAINFSNGYSILLVFSLFFSFDMEIVELKWASPFFFFFSSFKVLFG